MKKKYTPGPWKITLNTTPGQFVTDTKVRDQYDGVVAVMHIDAEANANLIAAAPDMLEQLDEAVRFINSLLDASPDEAADFLTNNGEKVVDGLKSAIRKAKGEA